MPSGSIEQEPSSFLGPPPPYSSISLPCSPTNPPLSVSPDATPRPPARHLSSYPPLLPLPPLPPPPHTHPSQLHLGVFLTHPSMQRFPNSHVPYASQVSSHTQHHVSRRTRSASTLSRPMYSGPGYGDARYDSSESDDGQELIYTSRRPENTFISRLAPNNYCSRSSPSSHTSTPVTPGSIRTTLNTLNNHFNHSNPMAAGVAGNGVNHVKNKTISTTPSQRGAGEIETEVDDPPNRLRTARTVPSSSPLTPFLFEFSRFLSIVPAVVGTLYNLYHAFRPPTSSPFPNRNPPEWIDYFVSALWAILTGYQCLALTTGLLTRWRLYYRPQSTLVRLLALQGICWPATQVTLSLFEHRKRPLIVWALIGTTTCCSRSIQIWVTSNLWWETHIGGGDGKGAGAGAADAVGAGDGGDGSGSGIEVDSDDVVGVPRLRRGHRRRWGGKWGARRWDWKEVGLKCVLPAGVMYFITAWAELLRREWGVIRC